MRIECYFLARRHGGNPSVKITDYAYHVHEGWSECDRLRVLVRGRRAEDTRANIEAQTATFDLLNRYALHPVHLGPPMLR